MENAKLDADEQRLLDATPVDGAAIGNVSLKRSLKWDDNKYWQVRDRLLEKSILVLGRGKGGSIRRVQSVIPEATVVAPQAAISGIEPDKESSLYDPALKVLREKWARDLGLEEFFVQRTAQQGRRDTGGRWTRPDLVAVYVSNYQYVPGRTLEVVTFELKDETHADVTAVYEALAHLRAATRAYVVVRIPNPDEAVTIELIEDLAGEARRHSVGLIVTSNISDYDTWDFRVEAGRREPDPAALNEFIDAQIEEDNKSKLAKWVK